MPRRRRRLRGGVSTIERRFFDGGKLNTNRFLGVDIPPPAVKRSINVPDDLISMPPGARQTNTVKLRGKSDDLIKALSR